MDEFRAMMDPATSGATMPGESAGPGATAGVGTWTPGGETLSVPSEDALIAAIGTVYDPEIPVNVYELGLIYAVEIADAGHIAVEMTLTAPGCPSAQELPEMVRLAVMTVPGVTSAEVTTVWDPPWDPSRMSEEARLSLNMF